MKRTKTKTIIAIMWTFSFAACSFRIDKTKDASGGVESQNIKSFATLKSDILDTRCARCHTGPSGDGGVDLSSYESILRNPGLVEPGQPSQSRLYTEVASGDMPESGPSLSPSEMQAIEDWILAGAPDGDFDSSSETPAPRPPEPPQPGPTEPTPPPPSSATFTTVQSQIFASSCVRCHSGPRPSGKVDLSSYASLMARPRNIVPGSPKQSLVYTEIESGSMPPRGAKVDPQLVKLLENWISKGAPND